MFNVCNSEVHLAVVILCEMTCHLRVHRAGPREKIYFKPEEVKAAIVTCGGLCPGLNDVIRQVSVVFKFQFCCWPPVCNNQQLLGYLFD